MNPVIFQIVSAAFGLLQVKLERDVILSKIQAMENSGKTPEQIVVELTKLRNDAIANAQAIIEAARGKA